VSQIVHVSLGRELGGLPEIVRAEVRELQKRGISTDWLSVDWPVRLKAVSEALSDWLHDVPARSPVTAAAARSALADVSAANAAYVLDATNRGDVVVLHDPVPLGLAPHLKDRRVVWRSHIGAENREGHVTTAVRALNPFLAHVELALFHRPDYMWADIRSQGVVCPPGIDIDDIKHRDLPCHLGQKTALLADGRLAGQAAGTSSRPLLEDHGTGFLRAPDARFILHVSRWDPLKGQVAGLRASIPALELSDLEYVLVGPEVGQTLMGKTNRRVLLALLQLHAQLSPRVRDRIHLWEFKDASPSSPAQREALNILRRSAEVVVSPSLREGFGLGVTEALYGRAKALATPAGGHVDQIHSGANGWLATVHDDQWWRALSEVSRPRALDAEVRANARKTVEDRYTITRSVDRQLGLLRGLGIALPDRGPKE